MKTKYGWMEWLWCTETWISPLFITFIAILFSFEHVWLRTPSADALREICFFFSSIWCVQHIFETMTSVYICLCDEKWLEKSTNARNNHKALTIKTNEIWTKTKEKCCKLTQTQQESLQLRCVARLFRTTHFIFFFVWFCRWH